MAHEMIIGVTVTDGEIYSEYRAAIAPLLQKYGGHFPYDFTVSNVISSEADFSINRMFAFRFGDRDAKDRFFADPDYKTIRAAFFPRCVETFTVIAEYDRP